MKYLYSLFLVSFTLHAYAGEIRVAAASNLNFVLPVLAKKFEKQTGHHLMISYAASGTLTTQIEHGAPFEIFLSAAPQYINRLKKEKLTIGEQVNYAKAQMVLFISNQSVLDITQGMQGLKTAVGQGKLIKIAIANPKHAPYGKAAQNELEKVGIWKQIQPYLLIAENASQAVQFSLTSSVDAGIVPYGSILQAPIPIDGSYTKLDSTLQQQAILLRGPSKIAQQFLTFIQQPQAKKILLQYGFL